MSVPPSLCQEGWKLLVRWGQGWLSLARCSATQKAAQGLSSAPAVLSERGNFSSALRWLQIKLAASPGNLGPAMLRGLPPWSGMDPGALVGGEGSCGAPQHRVPPLSPSLFCGSLHLRGFGGAGLSLRSSPGRNAAHLGVPGSSWAGTGWGVPSFTRSGCVGHLRHPLQHMGGSGQDVSHPLHQLSVYGVFPGKVKPTTCSGAGNICVGGKGVAWSCVGWGAPCLGPLGVSAQRVQQMGNPMARSPLQLT